MSRLEDRLAEIVRASFNEALTDALRATAATTEEAEPLLTRQTILDALAKLPTPRVGLIVASQFCERGQVYKMHPDQELCEDAADVILTVHPDDLEDVVRACGATKDKAGRRYQFAYYDTPTPSWLTNPANVLRSADRITWRSFP